MEALIAGGALAGALAAFTQAVKPWLPEGTERPLVWSLALLICMVVGFRAGIDLYQAGLYGSGVAVSAIGMYETVIKPVARARARRMK